MKNFWMFIGLLVLFVPMAVHAAPNNCKYGNLNKAHAAARGYIVQALNDQQKNNVIDYEQQRHSPSLIKKLTTLKQNSWYAGYMPPVGSYPESPGAIEITDDQDRCVLFEDQVGAIETLKIINGEW
ncbi:MAG: hypothetical protein KGI37_07615 [Alphaproteobacteria bacterium]|nr:hypothetical protein [Alphaproteobacteria bacterium]